MRCENNSKRDFREVGFGISSVHPLGPATRVLVVMLRIMPYIHRRGWEMHMLVGPQIHSGLGNEENSKVPADNPGCGMQLYWLSYCGSY